eukprot:TRINITY_DN14110_c0_g1_i1.p1 TRINITY_DN14110_c0_g1~~TRINITY_DN14110_c0_g1_i1.p1  ORF type:complete len:110 (+),score=13.11 TRINITY_DN14110_c0_g1_i1:33-332(+)
MPSLALGLCLLLVAAVQQQPQPAKFRAQFDLCLGSSTQKPFHILTLKKTFPPNTSCGVTLGRAYFASAFVSYSEYIRDKQPTYTSCGPTFAYVRRRHSC